MFPVVGEVVIRTNGGTLFVDAASDTVNHYGKATTVNIEAVADHSYYENGIVSGILSVKKGHVVVNENKKAETACANILITGADVQLEVKDSSPILIDFGIELTDETSINGVKGTDTNFDKVSEITTEGELNAATKTNKFYKLGNNIVLTNNCVVKGNVTIDLNGFEIADNNDDSYQSLFVVYGGAHLTINDSSKEQTGKITGGNDWHCVVILLTSCIDPNNSDASMAARATINGGTLYSKDWFTIAGNGTRHNTEITVNGGKLISDGEATAIYQPQNGILTINGGYFEGAETAIEIRSGNLTINGGKFVSTASKFESVGNGSGTTCKGTAIAIAQHTTKLPITVVINGGVFEGPYHISMVDAQSNKTSDVFVAIYGGTFDDDKVQNQSDGKWTLYNYRDYLEK